MPHPRTLALLAGAAFVLLTAGGCAMQRTVTIDSNPTGAAIWVNGVKQPGVTPVTVPFSQYGYFDVRLEKEGYSSVATEVRIASQIDGYPIVDLPFEIIGGTRSFRRVIPLQPLSPEAPRRDVDDVMDRARAFKKQTHDEVGEPDTPGRAAPEFIR